MSVDITRIAINTGGEYCPGLECVVAGAALAAHELSWEVVGIRDGYEGLLFPDRYPQGGTFSVDPSVACAAALGGSHVDPFRVHALHGDAVEDVDRSDALLSRLREQRIDAVVSIVGRRAMSVAWKLQRKGLPTVCVPVSVENDLAATGLSFGFNATLSCTVDLLDRARQAARVSRRLAVAEVLGQYTGWLALQAGIAARADAIFIPELSGDMAGIAAQLARRRDAGRVLALVVVAEGVHLVPQDAQDAAPVAGDLEARRKALSPGSATGDARRVIERSGAVAQAIAIDLQRCLSIETFALAFGSMVCGGAPTATDRQLGLAYGAAAVHGLRHGQTNAVVAFHPPKLVFVPLADAVNKTRTVPLDSHFLLAGRAMGIALRSKGGQDDVR